MKPLTQKDVPKLKERWIREQMWTLILLVPTKEDIDAITESVIKTMKAKTLKELKALIPVNQLDFYEEFGLDEEDVGLG
jgi:hypothetical protein